MVTLRSPPGIMPGSIWHNKGTYSIVDQNRNMVKLPYKRIYTCMHCARGWVTMPQLVAAVNMGRKEQVIFRLKWVNS